MQMGIFYGSQAIDMVDQLPQSCCAEPVRGKDQPGQVFEIWFIQFFGQSTA